MAKLPHPYKTANILSKMTFWWMTRLFYKGYKKGVEPEDIYEVLPAHSASYLAHRVERYMNHPKLQKKHTLAWALLYVFWDKMLLSCILIILYEGLKVVQPVLVGELVRYFQGSGAISDTSAYIYGTLLALTGMLVWLPSSNFFFINQVIGMQMRTACSTLIYKKSLKLSQSCLSLISTGRVVNLMSTDVEKFNMGSMFYHYLWLAPLEIVIVMYLLYREVGWSFTPCLVFVVLMMPVQALNAKLFNKLRYQIASLTDRRIHVMSELISAMRVIKMYCWEIPFGKLVSQLRRSEMKYIWRSSTIKGQMETLSNVSPKIATFGIMITYYLTGGVITADVVIKVISWTELLKHGMLWMLTLSVQYTTEMFASIDRMQQFLNSDELESVGQPLQKPKIEDLNRESQALVQIDGVTAAWDRFGGDTLKNLNLHINKGELVAIIGDVGAGKSSILMVLLGELGVKTGSVQVSGSVAYVPQEAWVFSATVRDNILFGEQYDQAKYQTAVKACSLDKDFQLMENNDMTIIGEKGLSLSGGQKARINLARAAYRSADLYIMDDPLSAVDPKVARHLFEKCVCGKMKDTTRVLVTHQIQFLHRADKVIVMKNGSVEATGRFEEVSKFVDIASIVATAEKEREMSELSREPLRSSMLRHRRHSSLDTIASLPGEEIDLEILDDMNEYKPVTEEDRMKGSVSFRVYTGYFGAGSGCILFPIFLLLVIGAQTCMNLSDWILSEWQSKTDQDLTMYIYIGLFLGLLLLAVLKSLIFFIMTSRASQKLHDKMFSSLLRAPIVFYDKNPVGRILNRFSRDIGFIDDILPQTLHQIIMFFMSFLGTMVFVSVTNYWTLLLTIPVIIMIVGLRQFAVRATRDIKRIEAASRSPVYSHLSATLVGLPVIRAFKVQDDFIHNFYTYQDDQTSPWMLYIAAHRWFGVRTDWCISTYFTGCLIAAFFMPQNSAQGGMIGLSLSYILAMLGFVQFIMRQSAEAESYMTSVERVQEYTKLEPEAAQHNPSYRPPEGWPSSGKLEFDNICLSYGEKNVLSNITIQIKDGEKVGIVGRTGAGKSSLIASLLRLTEPTGKIFIDGLDATQLGLADLRNSLSIIPQDPVLFSGTLRYNLDPLSEYSDDQLWNALSQVQLLDKVKSMEGELYGEMSESGSNLSVGQRQLACLARAILRNKKILLIDEATANVDPRTDALIQKTLRTNFRDCTVLCIAHRLNTIIDSDKVLVLDQGNIVEFDHPHLLLQHDRGYFYQMVLQTGPQTEQRLHSLAKAAYISKMTGQGDVAIFGLHRDNEATTIREEQDDKNDNENEFSPDISHPDIETRAKFEIQNDKICNGSSCLNTAPNDSYSEDCESNEPDVVTELRGLDNNGFKSNEECDIHL